MKSIVSLLVTGTALAVALRAQSPAPAKPMEKLTSNVYVWEQLKVEAVKNGERRAVFDGPTATLDKLHCHITTLNPGEKSGEPRLHHQEEVIIVKEGTVEALADGVTRVAPAGSVIFFQANAVTALRNVGNGPATYTVVYYHTPLTKQN
jgi:uncharacterized cupin superfamily protein